MCVFLTILINNLYLNIRINKIKCYLQEFKENTSSFSLSGKIIKSKDDRLKFGSEMNTSVTSGILEIFLGPLEVLSSVTIALNKY